MHDYDFLCNDCQKRFSIHYKTYADYDADTPACPACHSTSLSRIISKVAILQHKPERDYHAMSGKELNTAIHSPDSRKVGGLFRQIAEHEPGTTPEFHEVTKRLLKGESMGRIEREVTIPDTVPDGPKLAHELIDLKIRHAEHRHKMHAPDKKA